MSTESPLSPEKLAQLTAQAALDLKAQDVVIIDIQGRSSYADFLVIASGTSDRHVVSIADNIQATLKNDHEILPRGVEGTREGQWVLVDLGDIIAHIFHQFTREEYRIEEIWKEAPKRVVEDSASPGLQATP